MISAMGGSVSIPPEEGRHLTIRDTIAIIGEGNFVESEKEFLATARKNVNLAYDEKIDRETAWITVEQLKQFVESLSPNTVGSQSESVAPVEAPLPPIRLIDFEDFKKLDSMPRYPEKKDLCVNLKDVDRSSALIIFISHCWLRGWSGADGWDGRPHPDNITHDKFKLCVQGIDMVCKGFGPDFTKAYVWLDFGCINQDGSPAGELKQLDEIVRNCDCLFTPVCGEAVELPNFISNWYKEYPAPLWNAEQYGYVNRCWCRVEMFYAANIPVEISDERLAKFHGPFKAHAAKLIRPHVLYGTREQVQNASPFILPPMQNSYFEDLHPLRGSITQKADLEKIAELVEELKPYMKRIETGYEGEYLNSKKHGHGTFSYPNGDKYVGSWENGKKHGKGKLYFASGSTYEGDWVEDKWHGIGEFASANNDVYSGEFCNDLKHGKGVLKYSDGGVYDGYWADDKMNGQGVYTLVNETDYICCDGEWRDGQFIGPSYGGF